MVMLKNGVRITDLIDWELRAGPKRADQWVDGRSAKEAARTWLQCGSSLPTEVADVFTTHSAFGPVRSWAAVPELKLPFDNFRGESRNSDLVVDAYDHFGRILIAVEAKADEPFSETVEDALGAAVLRRLQNNRSNGVTRIEQLAAALLGLEQVGEPAVKTIRYQLLTACAGALCEAARRGVTRVVVLIHEFYTDITNDDKHVSNARDLDFFVTMLSHGACQSIKAGRIYGPFEVPGKPLLDKPASLYLSKVVKNIRVPQRFTAPPQRAT